MTLKDVKDVMESRKAAKKKEERKKEHFRDGMYMPEWRKKVEEERKVKYITRLSQVPQLSAGERERLQKVADIFGFRTNSYYLSLIDWDDPDDPVRNIIIPQVPELGDDGLLDASHEHAITVAPGCEHKYTRTALILISNVCGGICRFCFRKRIFLKDNREIAPRLDAAFEYIRSHPEIDNVLLTGGDALMLSTRKLSRIFAELRKIEHIKCIRLGSKLLAFNPFRFLDDPELVQLLSDHSLPYGRIYIVTHFNHPNELTDVSVAAVRYLQSYGVLLVNQTPLLHGINDNADTLAELFIKLAQVGVPPYYVFQCRPTRGNAHFKVPLIKAMDIFEKAKAQISGLAKRARFVGSHASGKIEILAYDSEWFYFKYHQSKDPKYYGQMFKLPRNDEAMWWEDWMPNGESFTLDTCPEARLGSGTF